MMPENWVCLTRQSCHTHTSGLVIQSESGIVMLWPIRGGHLNDSSDWHERRGSLGPTLPTSQNELNSGPCLVQLWRTEERTETFLLSSKLHFTLAWANICHWLQKYSKLSTSQNHHKQTSVSETFRCFNCHLEKYKDVPLKLKVAQFFLCFAPR